MGVFTVKLQLPSFVPKEEILGKQVFDRELVCLGVVKDWTYSSNGLIEMVVKMSNKSQKSRILVPFSHIEKVGELITLKTKRNQYEETVEEIQKGELKYKIDKSTVSQIVNLA